MYKYYKHFLFAFLMMLLWIPLLQKQYHFFEEKPLGGYYLVPDKPLFSKNEWISGDFAEQYNRYFNYSVGFRGDIIRSRNQFYYSMLNSSAESDYIVGKNKNLFYINNVRSVTGDDFKGQEFITKRIKKLELVTDSLKARGIPLFVVIAPGKANLYRDDLPKKYIWADSTATNYYWLSRALKKTKVPNIDFHRYYLQMKDTTSHPLFTLGSLHWSTYNLIHTYDSILKFMKTLPGGKPVASIYIGKVMESDSASAQEMDQQDGMNIFTSLKKEKYYYPEWSVIDTPQVEPKVLFISDSFFLSFVNKYLTYNSLDYECWFYHRDLYPETFTKPTTIHEIDYWAHVFNQDYICLLMSEVTWGEAGFDFVDNAYDYFTRDEKYIVQIYFDEVIKKIEENNKYISTTPSYYDLEIGKAKAQQLTLEEMIYIDAIYLTNVEYAQKLGSDTAGIELEKLLSNSSLVDNLLVKQKSPYAVSTKKYFMPAFAKYLVLKQISVSDLTAHLKDSTLNN